ncbi:hypothetical protein HMPREF3229_00411 [Peptoniphilus harei]|uniref:Uncharacterized protein n=1 Tax=Peptoniphilus harei TaxID=54005 RepID=A0A133PRJ8_9FIRM|nr:hypothetical protein HMPREF3229_00411 [Peptoniphilus harei]
MQKYLFAIIKITKLVYNERKQLLRNVKYLNNKNQTLRKKLLYLQIESAIIIYLSMYFEN